MTTSSSPTHSEEDLRPLRIAVIGAGPAGVYASDILLREVAKRGEDLGIGTTATVDLFEKLPVPFGLVRYGVAPDHPAIKWIMGALEKTLDNRAIRLFTNVEFGTDLKLDDLRRFYDVAIFATGAVEDRPLRLPGADLPQVHGAAEFVEWYDGYPYGAQTWNLSARQVAVIGGGNVAMDISRLLVKDPEALLETDIPVSVYEGLKKNQITDLHLFVRRGPAQAKFSVQELRELEKLSGVQLVVDPAEFVLDPATRELAERDKLTRQMLEELDVIADLSSAMTRDGGVDFEGNPAMRRYHIHFNANPTEILSKNGVVTGLRVERTEVGPEGVLRSTGEYTDYAVQAIYHAIGYRPADVTGIPYDSDRLTLRNVGGRVVEEEGQVIERVYSTGWAKRGPVGLIGSTKSDAMETVANLLDDLAASPLKGRTALEPDEAAVIATLLERGVKFSDFAGWKRVDAHERAEGAKVGREHIKVVDLEYLRALSRGE